MFRPAGVEALLQRLINEHPELITSHGLWEGINMTSGKVVKEQVFNNVVSFTLGMAGTGGSSMASYLEHKGLTSKLESIWDPQAPVSLTSGTSGNLNGTVLKGLSHIPDVRASGRELRITYQSPTPITGVKLELKHAGSNDPPIASTRLSNGFGFRRTRDHDPVIYIGTPVMLLSCFRSARLPEC